MNGPDHRHGLIAGVTAFGLWGLLPIYWKAIHWLPPASVICVRVLFCLPVLLVVLSWRGGMRALFSACRDWRTVLLHFCSAALLGGNWLVYVWATQNARIVEGSLGYFLTPLLNVALGMVFFQERLRRGQAIAVSLAAAGVGIMIAVSGAVPWVSLSLCVTFAFYGLLRKKARLDSLSGLTLESLLGAPVALGGLLLYPPDQIAGSAGEWFLLSISGILTTIPLLSFAIAARRLPFWTIGLLQFIAPSLQFLIGTFFYHEPLPTMKLVGFAFIWGGLFCFARDVRAQAAALKESPAV